MAERVWLNGRLIPLSAATISPLDRGFLYGDGLFETMRSYGGAIHLLRRHLDRLAHSAGRLHLPIPDTEELRTMLHSLLEANGGGIGCRRIRLTVSRGADIDGEPTVFARQTPLVENDMALSSGELTVLGRRREMPEIFPRVKSLNYLPETLSRNELSARGYGEGILLSAEGFIAEGTVSNLFCVIRGVLVTPPTDLGILPGITRERVMQLAEGLGIPVRRRRFGLSDLLHADECFYTNSVREIVPVGSVDGMRIGPAFPGEATLRLQEAYRSECPDEDV